jgi:response regulator of citrate/malate metabolism
MPKNVSDALEGLATAQEMHRQEVAQNVSAATSSNDARLVELALKPGVHPAP